MKTLFAVILIAFSFIQVYAQKPLFHSRAFSLFLDKVVQGQYQAEAVSRTEIISNYKSDYKKRTSRNIVLKFSINGFDNERKPGQDHHFTIAAGKTIDTADFAFAKSDPAEYYQPQPKAFLEKDTDLLIRLDMREVLNDFKTKGYYQTLNDEKIMADEFEGVYIAGATPPLSWDFPSLKERKQFKLQDPEKDGIYEVIIHFSKYYSPSMDGENKTAWKLTEDISRFPQYQSPSILIDALYNMALEEMLKDLRPDGAFMAGAKWEGIWTRDISYSILLSLAVVNPDASKVSLMAKVKDGRIIQDTGTGGAWPVSSDRMTWALAAWEVYKVTGDKSWLKNSFEIIKKSSEADLATIYDKSTGLMCGESSFLDWREQTYPAWMDPKDIYKSKNLGTNAVHFQTYSILVQMAKLLGEPFEEYEKIALNIKNGLNKYFWIEDKGYFGQYLYGREYLSLSPKSEALGEALCILFNLADPVRQKQIVRMTPVMEFGIPCIFPQIPGIPPYHNNAVWPFVESFWAMASAKADNVKSVEKSIGSVYRAAALFLTNKENMVASTGDHMGTEINSDRQLWSLAANLALTYRIICGMEFNNESLTFHPYIPVGFGGIRTLKNFRYRNSVLSVTIKGYGSRIYSFSLDGKIQKEAVIPADLKGNHDIVITMANNYFPDETVNLQKYVVAPETPVVKLSDNVLKWEKIPDAENYIIVKNGEKFKGTKELLFNIQSGNTLDEYQVLAVNNKKVQSFLSAPEVLIPDKFVTVVEAEKSGNKTKNAYPGYEGSGYIMLSKDENKSVKYNVEIKDSGDYFFDFRYSNGNGPINTDNKCAIRNLKIDDYLAGVVIFPQRGDNSWNDWGYSNSLLIQLSAGKHTIELYYDENNDNMNGQINTALLDSFRMIYLNGKQRELN